ncbi:hypothetical protein ACFL6U_12185 [Planctomycetota bacterium]
MMKAIKITLVLLIAAAAINFIKADNIVDIRKALPFCDGQPPNAYHWGALVITLIFLWGLARLRRRDDD